MTIIVIFYSTAVCFPAAYPAMREQEDSYDSAVCCIIHGQGRSNQMLEVICICLQILEFSKDSSSLQDRAFSAIWPISLGKLIKSLLKCIFGTKKSIFTKFWKSILRILILIPDPIPDFE